MRKKFILVLLAVLAIPCHAATITVDDDGPADFDNIQAGINAAGEGDVVLVSDGVYFGAGNFNINFQGKAITVQSANGPGACIIDCQGQGSGFRFNSGETTSSIVDGLTIIGGYGSSYGGGIYCQSNCSPTITNCVIKNNRASYGGGIYCGGQSAIVISNCEVSGNSASSYGGGIYCEDNATPEISDCQIVNNTSSSYAGGVYLDYYVEAEISNCSILNNTSGYNGGGIFCSYYTECTIENCTIQGNTAGSDGGGFYCREGSTISISKCSFIGNSSGDEGGGVYCYFESQVSITNCIFIKNISDYRGGGICTYYCAPAIVNCTFYRNETVNYGGGICFRYGMSPSIVNCAFVGNTQHAVYRYYTDDYPTLLNCLFYSNSGGDFYDSYTYQSYTGAGIINTLPGASGNVSGDPLFAFEGDCHILAGSGCIDWGMNNPPTGLPGTDKDGNPRILAGSPFGAEVVDIGAYEFNRLASSIALSCESLEFVKEIEGGEPVDQMIQIRNCGGGILNWKIEEDCEWLSVNPSSGGSEGDISQVVVSVDTMRMPRGIYTTALNISDRGAANSPRTVWVTLRIKGKLRVPEQYSTIGAAVAVAMDGEVVEVSGGTYREQIELNKGIELLGLDTPIIDMNSIGGYAVVFNANNCVLDGFRITGGYMGMMVQSSGNKISNNIIIGSQTGIRLYSGASNNTLTNNQILDSQYTGLYIYYSSGNILRDNTIAGAPVNFDIEADSLEQYTQDIDISNTVDGKPIYYIMNSDDVYLDPDSNAGCIVAVGCTDVIIEGLELSGNAYGVILAYSGYCVVEDTVITNNSVAGILIESSEEHGITDNYIENNGAGIIITSSTNNYLRRNIIANNDRNFDCTGGTTDYLQDIDTSNTLDGKPLYYLSNQVSIVIDANSNAACVYAYGCRDITVRDLTFSGNGAGVTFVDSSVSTIENVKCAGNWRAGIELISTSRITVSNCEVTENPDGIHVYESEQCVINSNLIHGNDEGIYGQYSNLAVVNSIIRHNSPRGGIYLYDYTERQMTIQNCTIFGNVRENYYPYGGGIAVDYAYVPVKVSNCILWGNSPEQLGDSYYMDVSYCVVQGGFESDTSKGIIDADPMLTADGHLRLGSPCVDKGDPVPRYGGRDIDGESRVFNRRIDIGVDEYSDGDSDGLPNWFEERYLDPNGLAGNPDEDPDGDEYTNIKEYEWYSSDPMVPCSVYYVDSARPDDSNDGLSWETAKKTIGAAIMEAENSDRIVVATGYYGEDISPQGRQVVIESNDVDDAMTVASTIVGGTVNLIQGEMRGFTLSGLTISSSSYTSGITCKGSSPTIHDCVILSNRSYNSQQGGAITSINASPLVTNCIINGNAGYTTGAVYSSSSSLKFSNCVICGNLRMYGGAEGIIMYLLDSDVSINQCTIADSEYPDDSSSYGSGIYCLRSKLFIHNSILWNPLDLEINADDSSTISVMYSDIRKGQQGILGNWGGAGNINVDPHFANSGYWTYPPNYSNGYWVDGDYHLRSAGWRWTPNMSHGSHWVWDGVTSPCIDAGNPGTELGDELMTVPTDPDNEWGRNTRVDMGAYGGTVGASMPPHGWSILGDVSNDGLLDFADYAKCVNMQPEEGGDCPADLDRNGIVNILDVALLTEGWLGQTDWCGTVVPFEREATVNEAPIPSGGTGSGGTGGVVR